MLGPVLGQSWPYVLCLYRLRRLLFPVRHSAKELDEFIPGITFIVSAFNEEKVIEKKIRNCFSLIYPGEKFKLIVVTDGSQDQTVGIVSKYPTVKLMHQPERRGKISAINRAMKIVDTPIVVFSDANSFINSNALLSIVRHYQDSLVGGVAGEKKVLDPGKNSNAALEEGSYWKYESLLKSLDSSFYTVVGAAGELFSMRTELFEFLPEDIIIEDFVQSLLICKKGFTVKYEPTAVATESSSGSIREEKARKIRIVAGGFQAMGILKSLFNIFRYPLVSFQFISHRVLRWTICPVCLPLLFITNLLLVIQNQAYIYKVFMGFQVLFYGFAAAGLLFAYNNVKIRILNLAYYFVFMHANVYLGFWDFIRNRQTVLWEKATR